MDRIRPTDTALITTLRSFDKSYFKTADFRKLLGLSRESTYVTMSRLVRKGVLERLRKDVYRSITQGADYERISNELYYPSYLSFVSALSHYGILSQIPYTITLATNKPTKNMSISDIVIEYHHLKDDLFFGYVKLASNGIFIAEPEKALLDQLYLVARGTAVIVAKELDLKNIDCDKLRGYAKKFPPYIKPLLKEVYKYIGTTPITNETGDRIAWKRK